MVEPTSLIGSELLSVTSSWLVESGERSAVPAHVWLEVVPAGLVQVHTTPEGSVGLAREEPYAPYAIGGGLGGGDEVVVEVDQQTVPVENFLGETVTSVAGLRRGDPTVGWILEFETAGAGFANVQDELVVGVWPDARWAELGITRSVVPEPDR